MNNTPWGAAGGLVLRRPHSIGGEDMPQYVKCGWCGSLVHTDRRERHMRRAHQSTQEKNSYSPPPWVKEEVRQIMPVPPSPGGVDRPTELGHRKRRRPGGNLGALGRKTGPLSGRSARPLREGPMSTQRSRCSSCRKMHPIPGSNLCYQCSS